MSADVSLFGWDMAMLQAHRDYLAQGRLEEAREIRAAARKETAAQFTP